MREFWLCFVPLFVAVDVVGVLPMFINAAAGLSPALTRRLVVQSVATAAAVALLFLAGGPRVMVCLGITVADFTVAGGILLFVLSMSDLLTTDKIQRRVDFDRLGAVPLGVPLLTGPAVLTTSILLANKHGFLPTVAALLANLLLAGLVFTFAQGINRVLGKAGAKVISKIASLLLASIGVMMVRRGILAFLADTI